MGPGWVQNLGGLIPIRKGLPDVCECLLNAGHCARMFTDRWPVLKGPPTFLKGMFREVKLSVCGEGNGNPLQYSCL